MKHTRTILMHDEKLYQVHAAQGQLFQPLINQDKTDPSQIVRTYKSCKQQTDSISLSLLIRIYDKCINFYLYSLLFYLNVLTYFLSLSTGTPDPHEDKSLVFVEFDDGDNGKIPLDHIRMIPEDFPIVGRF